MVSIHQRPRGVHSSMSYSGESGYTSSTRGGQYSLPRSGNKKKCNADTKYPAIDIIKAHPRTTNNYCRALFFERLHALYQVRLGKKNMGTQQLPSGQQLEKPATEIKTLLLHDVAQSPQALFGQATHPVCSTQVYGDEKKRRRLTWRIRSFFFANTLVEMPFSREYFDTPDRSPPIMASTVAFALSSPIISPHGYLPGDVFFSVRPRFHRSQQRYRFRSHCIRAG